MDDCILWQGYIGPDGYGRLGNSRYAHVVAWEAVNGPVPEGLELDHKCRVRRCINADHLEPVTHAENMARGYWATKTHCIHGHEYTPENTLKGRKPHWRRCGKCVQRRSREYKEKVRGRRQA